MFAFRSQNVYQQGELLPRLVVVDGDAIADVLPIDTPFEGARELGELSLLPGFVDTHVHLNEPGRAEWEGFETATRAAAVGGVTTLVDMPLNSIPATTTLPALMQKRAAAEGKLSVDCALFGGVVPGNEKEIERLADAGVVGFKCFLVESGVDEFERVRESDLRKAMPMLAKTGKPLLVHAELEAPTHAHDYPARDYRSYLASRPPSWEQEAIEFLIRLSGEYGARSHVVHLSHAGALAKIHQARSSGVPVTVETCPHYLTFAAEEIPDGDTRYKCSPPIREASNREALWQGLRDGQIDFVVTDHSPCTPALKGLEKQDFMSAWGGVSSLQFGFSATYTAALSRGFGLGEVTEWMSSGPAEFAGLHKKGRIEKGMDADLLVFDPSSGFTVTPNIIEHRHALTPYEGHKLNGRVLETFLRGKLVQKDGVVLAERRGRLLDA